nr:PAS domain-containing protein [Candidatus Aminicenantes bacterium]NIM79166.1 PAS domain-containing protein [Candidatus Aminicenantes bacterium]NIN18451.1 PAS domain-containing protein [Candidatus Aminicenantes bacterium]NIN42339.1 PAS domain-containing protein [Candidatus Aminicenantes bacterium]NIN85105.1 PAS domain-containing protein [Candidatus Aminicenantes bacterium]
QSKEFNGRACHKSSDGEMFFGGTNGFNSFYPDRIEPNRNEPPIVITNFELLIEGPNKKGKIEEGKIVLSHKENVFTIEFSALDFSAPSKNMYKHKLEGVDKDWVEGDARKRSITYTNVSPGEHTFRVIGSNKDGTWNKEGETLKIKITPPFWQTWWFRIALGFLIIFAILAIHQMRTKYLRDKLAEQQRVQKILKQSRDEMERARDLAEIRHAENEKLLTAISVIFIAVDSDGMIFQWNKPAEKFFKIYRDDAVKKPFVEVLKGCISQDKLNKIIEKGLEQDKSASKEFEVSVDLKTKGKKGIRLLTSSISPIMDRTGRKLGFLLLAEDITHRKEEEMLRNLSKKLESLGQMASGIAHEIKTPLQYIGHNARFVSDSFHDAVNFYKTVIDSLPEIENSGKKEIAAKINQLVEEYDMEYITEEIPIASEQMIDGVNRVSDIIKAMTEFSHPGRGFKEKADINGLLKSTLVMVQNRIKKSADIQLELSKELPQIACFPAELNQVFLNLLVNALDAIVDTGNWGLIKISTTVERKEVVISISDTGCGIPEENSDDIFNPFFTTKEVGKGTGQGLSLAHNVIIEKHKGKLDFSSRVGEGTTFFIRLPIEGEH